MMLLADGSRVGYFCVFCLFNHGFAWIGRAQPSRVHTSEVLTVAQVH